MQNETDKKIDVLLKDPETGEMYSFEGVGDVWPEGDSWGGKVTVTTNKTQFVLFEIARVMASQKEGSPLIAQARRVLQTIYQKLDFFTIVPPEGGRGFRVQWTVKPGLRGVDEEMKEIIALPIFVRMLGEVYGVYNKEIVKGGPGVRVGAQWGKARFEVKKAQKEKRKTTPEDMRMEFTLLKLLRDYSTHRDPEHELYLLGNGGEIFEEIAAAIEGKITPEKARVGVIEIPQTELYKAYTGKPSATISRDERRRVDKLLETFQTDIETVIFKEILPNKTVKWYEMARPKITVDRLATLTEDEAAEREAGGKLPEGKTILKIRFHPAFTFDIEKKYALLPDDYLQRMEKAIGGGRSSSKFWLLNDYLNGIRGHGKKSGYETMLDFETLVNLLDLVRFKAKQGIPGTEKEIDEAARVAQEVGLVLSWTKQPGVKGQRQYLFKLNPDFGKA